MALVGASPRNMFPSADLPSFLFLQVLAVDSNRYSELVANLMVSSELGTSRNSSCNTLWPRDPPRSEDFHYENG